MAKEDPQMKIRLPIELKEKIQDLANKNNRSMNAEIVFILNQFIEDREKISNFSKETYSQLFSSLLDVEDELFKNDSIHYINATSNLAQALSAPAQRNFIKKFMTQHKIELEKQLKALDKK